MRSWLGILLAVVVLGGTFACTEPDHSPEGAERLRVPAGPGSGQPQLYTGPNGAVWLSWLESTSDTAHALRYATLDDTTWSEPVTVETGTDWFVNWADLPSVQPLPDGRVAAHYLQSNGPSPLAYTVQVTQTNGDGRWLHPTRLHADNSPTEHGFVSMVPWRNESLLSVWLDGRNMTGEGHGQGAMTLRGAVLGDDGTVTRRARVDERTCECCATSAVRVEEEAIVAYRDRSDGEVRDISLVHFDGDTWSTPTQIHDDGWTIEGCPVNGPALGAQGDRVVAAWFTVGSGTPQVKAAFSRDGGHHFSDPMVVAEGATKGRVDVVWRADGSAVVSWLGDAGDGGRIQVRAVTPDGEMSTERRVATVSAADRAVGFPKMARRGDEVYVAWVDAPDGAEADRVQMARLPVASLD